MAGKAAGDADGVTPMMAQYLRIASENPGYVLFYRMGDFYELFLGDAEVASKVLGIVLTRRGKHLGEDIPMCGVPVTRSEEYLHRLIAHGLRVAICEQVEDPAEARRRGARSVVERAVVRLVTAGTVTEEGLLEAAEPSRLVAVARASARGAVGVASVDITTGCFVVCETSPEGLGAVLARLEPREVVTDDATADDPLIGPAVTEGRHALTRAALRQASPESSERVLREWYGTATLDGFGALTPAEVAAGAVAVTYVARTQVASRPNLRPPCRLDAENGTVEIDASTRASLEITRSMSGERRGSLLHAVDQTVTPAGSRLLAERLAGPVTDVGAIRGRHDAVAWLVEAPALRAALRGALRGMTDLSRATSRLALGRGGPRDLAAVRDGLATAAGVSSAMSAHGSVPPDMAGAAARALATGDALRADLADVLADEPPLSRRDGGFVREGFDPDLDATRSLRDEARRFVAGLQARYCEETGVRTLRVKHTGQHGYLVEVPQSAAEGLASRHGGRFSRRHTLTDAVRFSTVELSDLDARVASAGERALELEGAAFDALAARVAESSEAVNLVADADGGGRRRVLPRRGGRLEGLVPPGGGRGQRLQGRRGAAPGGGGGARGARGAPSCPTTATCRGTPGAAGVAVVTGPNMAGKSTFLRQNAVIAVLAQAGSFVPADSAHVGVVDRLFSRVGASDDLARGRSTFMVEMVETAAILNGAGPRSLVVMDEIGRGTATYDGLSIAWAAMEHLHDENRCRCLFATHYHELTGLKGRDRLSNLSMRVVEHEDEVVFAHEVVAGAAGRSYGIHVARLAGLPASALRRAGSLLADLEARGRKGGPRATPPEMTLFDFAERQRAEPPTARPPDPALVALDALDPDALSPRQALQALYDLKRARAGAPSANRASA